MFRLRMIGDNIFKVRPKFLFLNQLLSFCDYSSEEMHIVATITSIRIPDFSSVNRERTTNNSQMMGTVNHTPKLLGCNELKRHRCDRTEGQDHWSGWKIRTVSIHVQPARTRDTQNTKTRKKQVNRQMCHILLELDKNQSWLKSTANGYQVLI